jgi:hypothetical protein
MAKKKISTYIFNPGRGVLENVAPDAYSMISSNKEYIKDEAVEYINYRIALDTSQDLNPNASAQFLANKPFIKRELKEWIQNEIASPQLAYTPSDATYTPTTGVLNITIGSHTYQPGDYIKIAIGGITFTCAKDNNATLHPYPRETGVSNITGNDPFAHNIIEISSVDATSITMNVGISSDTSVHSFSSALTNAVSTPFYQFTYDEVLWNTILNDLVNGMAYDVKYGGTFNTNSAIRLLWDDETSVIPGNRAAVQLILDELQTMLNDYVLQNILKTPVLQTEIIQAQAGSAAEAGVTSKITNFIVVAKQTVVNGLESIPVNTYGYAFAEYTYNEYKCERDIGYVIDAYLHDIRYTGNKSTYEVSSFYWKKGVPQVDGSRLPEVETHEFIETLINDYILQNTEFTTRQDPVRTPQAIDLSKTAEVGVISSITTLRTLLTDVIQNGTSALPEKVNGLGTIRVQGRYREEDILLITNVTKGEIIYTFNDPGKIADVEFLKDSDVDAAIEAEFSSFSQTADTITSIKLYFSTATHSSTDRLQIFIETPEIITRPFDFGTDAIERQRVANAQSMLDADFEYGLQPTKWQAIGMQRGYPSIYEIPGTELNVVDVVTDASIATSGIGASLITVTTTSPHSLNPGEPFTIKGLGGTALGIGRAEGSFVVTTIPSSTSFTYYAKSKVGTSNGQVLSTYYTQLRKAGFYTGAAVGSPSYKVSSQGSAGTFVTSLSHPTGSDTITVNGTIPELGAPLVQQGALPHSIPVGSQVTGSIGDGSGVQVTAGVAEDIPEGQNSFEVIDTSGIVVGMAIDLGDGSAGIVTTIAGQEVFLDRPLTANRAGSDVTYTELSANLLTATLGSGATFDVSRSAGSYTTSINNGGVDYVVNDVLELSGSLLGGVNPANNIYIRVTAVNAGVITAFTESGTAAPADGSFIGVSGQLQSGLGVGAFFDVTKTNNTYSVATSSLNETVNIAVPPPLGSGALFTVDAISGTYSIIIEFGGTNYEIGDQLVIDGSSLTGVSSTNDCSLTVTGIDGASGAITNVTSSGTAAAKDSTYSSFTATYAGATGTDAQFVIFQAGTVYSVQITNPGQNYVTNETFVVSGTELGGSSPANDATITVTGIGGTGDITTASIAGTALDSYSFSSQTGSLVYGQNAQVTITESAGSYSISIINGGEYFTTSSVITVPGITLRGVTLTNDATISVTGVNASGAITSANITGTPSDLRGSGYSNGDVIVITGDVLGGSDTVNDCTITVNSVGLSGEILTVSETGTATDGFASFDNAAYSTAGSGINAFFQVSRIGTTYSANITGGGSGFIVGDTLNILGTALGGATPTNDLVITVSQIDGNGGISDTNISGVALNTELLPAVTGINDAGSGALFNITNTATVYSLDLISDPGENYKQGDVIIISGVELGGASPANDFTITVSTVNGIGGITGTTISGTGGDGSGTYTALLGIYAQLVGNGSQFSVQRTVSNYVLSNIQLGGTGYQIGNTLLIPGGDVGGTGGVNDVSIVVEGIDATGTITNASINGTVTASAALEFYSTITMTEVLTAPLAAAVSVAFEQLATIEIDFENPHGIVPGATVIVAITSDDAVNNHNLAAGSFIATNVPTTSRISYQARTAGTIDTGTENDDPISGSVYLRPDSFFIHRPYDGGVQLGTGGPQHGAQAIRQSKNYIRYQSGKGIMYTTGALFAPSYDILSISATAATIGSLITIEIDDADHGLQVGGVIELLGVETAGYDGIYTVTDIVNERVLKITATTQLGSRLPVLSDSCQISVKSWHGSTVRAGAFDDQNGIFWEYDGDSLNVVQRSSTFQVAGLVNVEPEDNLVTGVGTRFKDQLKTGDRVVLKGMTHVISHIDSQTQMSLTPDYRGVRAAINAKMCLVKDKKVKQGDFNLDKMDGTGQSAYDVDISKMQMIGIQYSWYGAGFIDFMMRGSNGNFVFCHRMRNSNVNTEAFMRSGNLPVRYEVTNEGPNGKLAEAIDNTQTSITLEDASFFPNLGATLYIDNEIITYTGKNGNVLTGCTRGTNLINFQAGAQRTYTAGPAAAHARRTGVVILSSTITPIISHWGSAFITDGGFDEDRGYIFSYAATGVEISTTRQSAFLIRLAPSVSNAITGDLGDRELLNRAQLLLNGIEVTSDALGSTDTGGIIVEGILNPQNYPTSPSSVGWVSLNTQAEGGQPSFAQVVAGAGINWGVGATVTESANTVASGISLTATATVYNSGNTQAYILSNPVTPIESGMIITGANGNGQQVFRNNTIINSVQRNNSWIWFGSSSQRADRLNLNQTLLRGNAFGFTATVTYPAPDGITTKLLFTELDFLATGATTGTPISVTDANFPAGTIISSVETLTLDGTNYSVVELNQASLSTFTAGDSVIFDLTEAAYAKPGETIFKFIAVPGERSELDLSPIKELTNTSLGGRGAFPNGPDVLAINIRKTSGTPIKGNVILKWGEAQA